ncbi:Antitoxin YefM [Acaryochloris thomasi RCC1774]|uniref:Antitoxin YefM n=1 Tax=Acaryochloris thomasi RCC1774 TaxID=1764569 RepID=A0A2W1JP90_9CYAN|nr:Antitoxin YefM [Acaryochloris thomasi RCC1774]
MMQTTPSLLAVMLMIQYSLLMSLSTFNSLQERVHLLKSSANAIHLEHSIAQYREGKIAEHDLLDE